MFCAKCGTANEPNSKFCQKCGDVLDTHSLVPDGSDKYAGFWLRFVAYIIDVIIMMIPIIILRLILGQTGSIIGLILEWVYFAVMESSAGQATLGKKALGLKVTDLNGNRISFGRATGRFFSKLVSGMIFCVGYMLAGWTAEKRALHDFMASTLVVKKNA